MVLFLGVKSINAESYKDLATKEEINNIKDQRKEMNEKYSEEQNGDFYFVIVCKSQTEKDKLLSEMSIPKYEQYVTSEHLRRLKNNE